MAQPEALSKEEAQLYDRQLRLWGVQSQQRLQRSKVAIVGLNGVQSEVAKNIVLAGLNEITIYDWVTVEPRHTIPHLFLDPRTSIGQNRGVASKARLSELNPLVRVTVVETNSVEDALERFKVDAAAQTFDIVIASDLSTIQLCSLNEICRTVSPPDSHLLHMPTHPHLGRSLPFVALQTFGFFGFFFMDLGNHVYSRETTNEDGSKSFSTSLQVHNSLSSAFSHDPSITRPDALFYSLLALHQTELAITANSTESALTIIQAERSKLISANKINESKFTPDLVENLVRFRSVELAPVTAIMGGLVGQEVIKTLSASHPPPVNNFFFYNANTGASSTIQASNEQE